AAAIARRPGSRPDFRARDGSAALIYCALLNAESAMPALRRSLVLLSSLLLVGAGPCGVRIIEIGLPSAPAGGLPVRLQLPDGTDLAAVTVALDGADVTSA